MPTPDFILALRRQIGTAKLLLPGVTAIIVEDGRLLMIRRADNGEWSLPAGNCEPGEEPAWTIAREVHEETGYVAVPERIAAVANGPDVTYPNGDRCEYVTTFYVCRVVGGELAPRDGEALDVRWVPTDDPRAQARIAMMPADLATMLSATSPTFPWDEAWLEDLAG